MNGMNTDKVRFQKVGMTHPNPVGSTSNFSNFDQLNLREFLQRNYPNSVTKHARIPCDKGVFNPNFNGFAYAMKVADLNDTLMVSLDHPHPEHSIFGGKKGGKNGRPPKSIAKHSIFAPSKTGITQDSSSAGESL